MKKIFTILGVAAVSLVSAQNLIVNGGFENWTGDKPSDWFLPNGVTLEKSTNVVSGSFSAGLPSPATGNRTISQDGDIPVAEGTTYVFSGWYLDNSTTARFKYWNQFRNTGDTGANNMQAEEYSTDSPEWKFFSAEAMPNPGATLARAGLRVYPENGQGNGVILFDDIKFEVKILSVTDINNFKNAVKFNTIVSDQITFKLPTKATVNIYSMEGRLMSSSRVGNGESINTQYLTKGNYVVTVDNGTDKISKKIIKK